MKKYFNSNDARSLINTYGFSIFPIHGVQEDGACTCNNPQCNNIGKHPATPDGFKSASKDIEHVKRLWSGRKGLNVGIATGAASDVFVIDIDSPEAEEELYSKFAIPSTYTVKTGRGKHLYFKYNPDKPVKNGANIIKGVDVRGDGGYVAGAGSNHASGVTYECENPLEDFAICPDDLFEFCLSKKHAPLVEQLKPQPKPLININNNGWTLNQVREHLSYISPDVGYDEWIKVGMGLHSENIPFEVFDEWSRAGTKYDGSTQSHWKSFSKGGGVSYGTIVAYAKANGWQPRKNAENCGSLNIGQSNTNTAEIIDNETGEIKEVKTFNLLYADDIKPITDVRDFVEDVLTEEQFSVIYGESNCGKTFFMLDLALHVALGRKWRDKEVEQGGVIYAALEGASGTKNRISAFKQHYMIPSGIPMAIIPSNVNFIDSESDMPALVETIKQAQERIGNVKLIVIDTLARAMGGSDENSGQDMGTLIKNADMIREITKAHIAFIHHSGKDAAKGARGHSSLRAAVDTEIEISRHDKDSPSNIKIAKQREMEMIEDMAFKLESVKLGENRRGKQVTSCVVLPCDVVSEKDDIRLSPVQQFIYDAILDAVIRFGSERRVIKGQEPIKSITYDDMHVVLEERGYKNFLDTETSSGAEKMKNHTTNARVALNKKGKIASSNKYIWLLSKD